LPDLPEGSPERDNTLTKVSNDRSGVSIRLEAL
jgi:hypothetical protein